MMWRCLSRYQPTVKTQTRAVAITVHTMPHVLFCLPPLCLLLRAMKQLTELQRIAAAILSPQSRRFVAHKQRYKMIGKESLTGTR